MIAEDWYTFIVQQGFLVGDKLTCPKADSYLNIVFSGTTSVNILEKSCSAKKFEGVQFCTTSPVVVKDGKWIMWEEIDSSSNGNTYTSTWCCSLDSITGIRIWTFTGRVPTKK